MGTAHSPRWRSCLQAGCFIASQLIIALFMCLFRDYQLADIDYSGLPLGRWSKGNPFFGVYLRCKDYHVQHVVSCALLSFRATLAVSLFLNVGNPSFCFCSELSGKK